MGLKEGLVEFATVCVKSVIILKFIGELPKNEEEIQPCTIIDLSGKTRETIVKTPTTTIITTITLGVFRF